MSQFWVVLTATVYLSLCSSGHQNLSGIESEETTEVHRKPEDIEDSTRPKAWHKRVMPSCLKEKYNDKSCQKVYCRPWERCLQDRCRCLIPNECLQVGRPVCSLGGNQLPSYCKLKSLECLRKNSKYAFSNFVPCSMTTRFAIKEERGQLFLKISGDWLPVCTKMNMPAANVACRQLGLSLGAQGVEQKKMVDHELPEDMGQAVTKILCKGWESSIAECKYKLGRSNKCQSQGRVHVHCYKEERGCNSSEFECTNKKCVLRKNMCNGDDDCADRSDEMCCQSCSNVALLCSTGNCVAQSSLCDGEADCINHEDEANCPSTKQSEKYDNEIIVQERQKILDAALPICGNSSYEASSLPLPQPLSSQNRRSSRNRRLIGGTQAVLGQFPWQAALLKDREWICGAVFIGGNWFLTAAHCVAVIMAEYKVRVGELSRRTQLETLAKRPDVLRWVKLNLVGNCSAFHGERFTEGMECAGSLDGSADTCDGDSGGPLICYNFLNQAYVWGIVSWGHQCGSEGFPGVYVKVAFYYTWIRSITGKAIFKH
uniref:complement factor I-like isoform X2 n=1 Tax=Myxine glutinosa TaxID=7769 RepID=UPI0035901FB8